MVWLLLGGIGVLFIGLTFSYALGSSLNSWEEFRFPKMFWLSTLLIGVSSYTLEKARAAYRADEIKDLKNKLLQTGFLGLVFIVTQVMAWRDLQSQGIFLQGDPAASFLYVISGLHGLHILVGIGLVYYVLKVVFKKTADTVQRLLYLSDKKEEARLRIFSTYWHAMGILWAYLFLFFLFFNT